MNDTLSKATWAALVAACGFTPKRMEVFAGRRMTVSEALAPGEVSMLLPIPAGGAVAAFYDPQPSAALNSGIAVILAFQTRKDARTFGKLLAHERKVAARATHSEPARPQ